MAVTSTQRGPTKTQSIPEGSVIFCPGCGTGLYETLRDIVPSDIRHTTFLEPLTEHELADDQAPFVCPECKRLIIAPPGYYLYRPPRRALMRSTA